MDIGSNSVLLVVEELRESTWRQLFESSEVTGLGEGTKKTGVLGEAGMSRTLDALKRGFDKAHLMGVDDVLAAATMAARIAANTSEFQARAKAQGTPVVDPTPRHDPHGARRIVARGSRPDRADPTTCAPTPRDGIWSWPVPDDDADGGRARPHRGG